MKTFISNTSVLICLVTAGSACKTLQRDATSEVSKGSEVVQGSSATLYYDDDKSIRKLISKAEDKLGKSPKDIPSLIDLTKLYILQKKESKARESLQKILFTDLFNKEAARLMAEIEMLAKNNLKAETILLQVIEENPRDVEAYNLLGVIALDEKNLNKALDFFNQGLRISANHVAINLNLAKIHLQFRHFAAADQIAQKLLKINAEIRDAYLFCGISRYGMGDFKGSENFLRNFVEKNDNEPIGTYYLGLALFRQDKLQESLKYLKEAKSDGKLEDTYKGHSEKVVSYIDSELKRREEEERLKKEADKKAGQSLSAKPLEHRGKTGDKK